MSKMATPRNRLSEGASGSLKVSQNVVIGRLPALARSVCFRHARTGRGDIGADGIGVLGERDRGGIVRARLAGIAELLGGLGSAERGAETVRLLLERRLEGRERFFRHAALEQHRAQE